MQVCDGDNSRRAHPPANSMDYPPNKDGPITSDCDAMRSHGHQMALITSDCGTMRAVGTKWR